MTTSDMISASGLGTFVLASNLCGGFSYTRTSAQEI